MLHTWDTLRGPESDVLSQGQAYLSLIGLRVVGFLYPATLCQSLSVTLTVALSTALIALGLPGLSVVGLSWCVECLARRLTAQVAC